MQMIDVEAHVRRIISTQNTFFVSSFTIHKALTNKMIAKRKGKRSNFSSFFSRETIACSIDWIFDWFGFIFSLLFSHFNSSQQFVSRGFTTIVKTRKRTERSCVRTRNELNTLAKSAMRTLLWCYAMTKHTSKLSSMSFFQYFDEVVQYKTTARSRFNWYLVDFAVQKH